ncbi:MAG: aminoacyl-tRNA hydrolase [Clostridia bacterium]|nr:aminoacyl-tRNA hydrolase [Clostridia bacterium]MBQ1967519.1 aminoacyl-tRNA hydrolase [Clostridia bacterium]MBQ1996803.1 aminoacyl-tRNA hydrolase [Clostridia bacterium]MBQ5906204.1 aminoacyl-tRNA hydrolase [Clostridia bacterium]
MIFKKTTKDYGGSFDYMIVGLGNPGRQYETTRHNAGFICLDLLSEKHGIKITKLKFKSLMGDGRINGRRCLLLKPQTFMNLSGEAVRDAAEFYKIPPERIIVICDDISLDPGKIRIRRKGSAGGQNGMKNIIYHLNSDNFPRIKVGIGAKPNPDYDLADWVLSHFTKDEAKLIKEAAEKAVGSVEYMVEDKIDKAMSEYNS